MKVIGIIKEDKITDVQYGVIEIPDPENKKVVSIQKAIEKTQEVKKQKIRAENTKHK